MFLKNAWYVAAWGDEITEDLQKVMLLNESICMFRDSNGKVIALENACPHRKLPLTKGRRKGDAVECGYHGLTFNRHRAMHSCAGARWHSIQCKSARLPNRRALRSCLDLDGQSSTGRHF